MNIFFVYSCTAPFLSTKRFCATIILMKIISDSLIALEFDKVRKRLSRHAKCRQSEELCLSILPYETYEDVIKAQIYTKEAKAVFDMPGDIPLEFVGNVDEMEKFPLASYLNEKELVDVAKTFRTSRLVRNFMNENTGLTSQINTLARNLTSDKELEDKIFGTFDENLKIKKDATPELKALYASLREAEKSISTKVGELLNSADFVRHLQESIYTTRDERVVFQVKASDKSKVKGIVHDVSATGKTFYIEPESLIPLNNKLRETQSHINAECIRILTELTQIVKFNIPSLKNSEKILAQIDLHFAKARYAAEINAVEPEVLKDKKEIVLHRMKHPLLIGTVENIVANDFEIGRDCKSIIITGSNTGGKTVTLKTAGLYILMTRAGLFLPCCGAKIYPFKKVFADIGDSQSILQSLSTFSSHMRNIIEIIDNSDEESFVLLDEICAGTDPVEGAVLARSILEKLAKNNVYSIVTTHYGELKALEYLNPYFKNASVEFDVHSLRPTYRLLTGVPGLSNAIAVSSTLGLDKSIVEDAKETLVTQKDSSILVVEKLQEVSRKLNENLQEAEVLRKKAGDLKLEYEKKLAEIKNGKGKALREVKRKFNEELLEAKNEIKDIIDSLRKEKTEKIARRSYSRLGKLESVYREKIGIYEEKEQYAEIVWEKVKINDRLILKEVHQPVTVLSLPDKSGNVVVLMGNIKTKVKQDKLAPFSPVYEREIPAYLPPKGGHFSINRIDISNRLDLRGARVEDALDELEEYLDRACLANLPSVTIIHGHGTGALKSAVRDYLVSSPYAAKFRPGGDNEGGDGVSVVDIN